MRSGRDSESVPAGRGGVRLIEFFCLRRPQCGAGVAEGQLGRGAFDGILNCRVAAEKKQQPQEQPIPLVVVLETNDQIQLAMAKGLLVDAGIPLFIQGQIATLYQSVDGFLRKWVRLQVPEDRAEEAQEVLQPVLNPRPYL